MCVCVWSGKADGGVIQVHGRPSGFPTGSFGRWAVYWPNRRSSPRPRGQTGYTHRVEVVFFQGEEWTCWGAGLGFRPPRGGSPGEKPTVGNYIRIT